MLEMLPSFQIVSIGGVGGGFGAVLSPPVTCVSWRAVATPTRGERGAGFVMALRLASHVPERVINGFTSVQIGAVRRSRVDWSVRPSLRLV